MIKTLDATISLFSARLHSKGPAHGTTMQWGNRGFSIITLSYIQSALLKFPSF